MRAKYNSIPLREVCRNWKDDIVSGPFGSNLKREHFTSTGVPVLKLQNVKPQGLITNNLDYVSSEKAEELSRHSFKAGDIVVTKLGAPLGVAAIVTGLEHGIIVADLVRIRTSEIDTQYLCYFINSPAVSWLLNGKRGGATRPRINLDVLRDLSIPVPPLSEQRRIVAILDEAFEGIAAAKANVEKNLENAREVFESYLNQVFSDKGDDWEEGLLGDVVDVRDGTHDSPKYVSKGIPFVTQKNIKPDGLSLENTKYISLEDHKKIHKRSNVAVGDILISMIGANRGMACIVDDQSVFSIKNVGLIKESDTFEQAFLLYFLKSKDAKRYISDSSRGGAQPFVGLKKLRSFPVPIAPLSKQTVLVSKLKSIDEETKAAYKAIETKMSALDELKKSLLHQAFNCDL